MGGAEHVRFDHQIFVKEIGAIGVVRQDAADLRRREEDGVGLRLGDPALGRRLRRQVDGGAIDGQDLDSSRLASRRTSADPTMPRWPATQTRLPSRRKGRLFGHSLRFSRRRPHQDPPAPFPRRASSSSVSCFQPSFSRALLGSPTRTSTSVGRK